MRLLRDNKQQVKGGEQPGSLQITLRFLIILPLLRATMVDKSFCLGTRCCLPSQHWPLQESHRFGNNLTTACFRSSPWGSRESTDTPAISDSTSMIESHNGRHVLVMGLDAALRPNIDFSTDLATIRQQPASAAHDEDLLYERGFKRSRGVLWIDVRWRFNLRTKRCLPHARAFLATFGNYDDSTFTAGAFQHPTMAVQRMS